MGLTEGGHMNKAQRDRVRSLGKPDRTLDTFPLWDVPNGSVLAIQAGADGNARWVEIIEPEPTFRFCYDAGGPA